MTLRGNLLLSIILALALFVVVATCPVSREVAVPAAFGLGVAVGLWFGALVVLADGMVMAEVVTLTRQSRRHGLVVVIA
jgi:hypothetical protein